MTESERQTANLELHDGSYVYGIDWGIPEHDLPCVLSEWIGPRVAAKTVAIEIGSGGGRWSRYFQPAAMTYLVDATTKSEALIRQHCDCERFRFLLSPDGKLPAIPSESVDYAFSWDTFVHFDRELFDAYLGEIARVLKPDGVLHLHYAQTLTENQSEKFRYREPRELFATMAAIGFRPPTRRWFLPEGWGSVMVECYRASKS